MENDAQILLHSAQFHQKSTKLVPRSAPKATSEASRRKVGHIFEQNATIFEKWMILAAILRFSWDQLGTRRGTKIHFLAPSLPKISNNEIQNEVSEIYNLLIEF